MDKKAFEGNMGILDKEIESLMGSLDVIDGSKDEYGVISRNLKTMLECKAIEARNLESAEKLDEERRQFDARQKADAEERAEKLQLEREKQEQELALAEAKLEAEQRQADQRHKHDIAVLDEERRHNRKDEEMRFKAERNKNIITGSGILLTTGLAAAIYAGERSGMVIGSGATNILKLIRLPL